MTLSLIVRTGSLSPDVAKLSFDAERIVIGRGRSSDLRLPDPSISARHASIQQRGADFVILDEGSTNGTFVGKTRLLPRTPEPLRSGDLIRIGRVWIEVVLDMTPQTRDPALAASDLAMLLVQTGLSAAGEETRPIVRLVERGTPSDEITLSEEGRAYEFGTAADADLPLRNPRGERTSVLVTRRGAHVLARLSEASEAVTLGDVVMPFDRDVTWKISHVIRTGDAVAMLEDPVASALAHIEDQGDEILEPRDAPPPAPISVPRISAPRIVAPSDTPAPTKARAASIPKVASQRPAPLRAARKTKDKGSWSAFDAMVLIAGFAVLAVSVAGLVYLFRGR